MPPWFWVLLRALAVGAVYAGIYELITVETSFGTSIGSTLWPASGVTVSVLLLRPRREWPFYLVAIGLADFTMDIVSAGFPVRVAYGLAAANCLAIARIGGDEFVILLDRVAHPDSLPRLAARIQQVVGEPIAGDAATVRMGASVGYSTTERPDESYEALLTRADHAMYAAKQLRA